MGEQSTPPTGGATGPTEPSEEERRRREEALRVLRSTSVSATRPATARAGATGGASGAAARGGMRRWLLVAALVVLLVAGGGGFYLTHRPVKTASVTPGIPKQLTIDLNALQLSCVASTVAWSPTSDLIAVSGLPGAYSQNCGAQNWVVMLLDARTGKKVKVLNPASTGQPIAYQGAPADWTPDGKNLLLSGFANDVPLQAGKPVTPALLVLPVDGGPSRLLRGTPFDPAALPKQMTYYVWDMQAGDEAHAAVANPAPGLSYTWTPDGLLAPSAPLPKFTSATSYSGSPTLGGGMVPHWLPGTITPLNSTENYTGPQRPPEAMLYTSQSSAWSPDGRYYIPYLTLETKLPPVPGVKRTPIYRPDCAKYAYYALLCDPSQPPAAYPDVAFGLLAVDVEKALAPQSSNNPSIGFYGGASVDWRPDGKYLATMLPGEGFEAVRSGTGGSNATVKVSILRTDDGSVATKLSFTHTGGYGVGAGTPYTFWSPDGKRLALFDSGANKIIVWGGSSLPA